MNQCKSTCDPCGVDHEVERPVTRARHILHRKNLRAFILDAAKHAHPSWEPTSVTGELMDLIEYKVGAMIRSSVQRHPPQGKTVRDLY